MVVELIIGIQQQGVIVMMKYFLLNCNEINWYWLDVVIDFDVYCELDLLVFEIVIEWLQFGVVMVVYNKVNGDYVVGNDYLFNDVLKGVWGYCGWVMLDWGGIFSWECVLVGLD